MRVLMVGREYPPYTVGGVATHTYHLVRALRARGVWVDVVSYGYRGGVAESSRGRVFFLEPRSSIISRRDEGVARDIGVPRDILRLTRFVHALLEREGYDIVHVQEPYVGGLISYRAKVTTIHDTSYGEIRAIFHTALNAHNARRAVFFATMGYWMEYASIATSKLIITPSPQVRDELIHVYHAWKPVLVIPNGVEEPGPWEPGREEAKKLLGLGDRLVVFTVAQHVARKRIETLLYAARLLRGKWEGRVVVVIGGRGPLTPWLRREAERLGLEGFVRFTGWIPGEKLPLYYRAADVFVVTSEYEAGPITLLEAGIRGVALVSTSIPGFPALLSHGVNALLYPVGDYRALARLLDELLGDEGLRERLGREAVAFASRFTWKRVAGLTLSAYRRVLGRSGG